MNRCLRINVRRTFNTNCILEYIRKDKLEDLNFDKLIFDLPEFYNQLHSRNESAVKSSVARLELLLYRLFAYSMEDFTGKKILYSHFLCLIVIILKQRSHPSMKISEQICLQIIDNCMQCSESHRLIECILSNKLLYVLLMKMNNCAYPHMHTLLKIVLKIITSRHGSNYICFSFRRFSQFAILLTKLALHVEKSPGIDFLILYHIIKIFSALATHPRGQMCLRDALPDTFRQGKIYHASVENHLRRHILTLVSQVPENFYPFNTTLFNIKKTTDSNTPVYLSCYLRGFTSKNFNKCARHDIFEEI